MKELLMMILFHISIYLTNSLNLNNEFIDTFFKNKKSDIFTNSTHDVEYFCKTLIKQNMILYARSILKIV